MITINYVTQEDGSELKQLSFSSKSYDGFPDVQRVIDGNRPLKAIKMRVGNYLQGLAVHQFDDVEQEYCELFNQIKLLEFQGNYNTEEFEDLKFRRDRLEVEYAYLKNYRITDDYSHTYPTEPTDQSDFLDQLKKKLKEYTETLRINYLKLGYTSSLGIKMDCKDNDITNWNSALTGLNLTGALEITFADYNNQGQTISKADFETICIELSAHWQGAFTKKWSIRSNVDGVTKASELLDINYSF